MSEEIALYNWISIKERLPEIVEGTNFSESVLTVDTYDYMEVSYICKEYNKWVGTENITHWQPLPEPPKNQTQGT